MFILNLRRMFVVCLLGPDDSDLKGALKSFLLVMQDIYNLYTRAFPTPRHAVTHTYTHIHTRVHTHKQCTEGQRDQSWTPQSMSVLWRMHCDREPDSPLHPREIGISRDPMQPAARSTKPPFGWETAPNTQSSHDCQRQLR